MKTAELLEGGYYVSIMSPISEGYTLQMKVQGVPKLTDYFINVDISTRNKSYIQQRNWCQFVAKCLEFFSCYRHFNQNCKTRFTRTKPINQLSISVLKVSEIRSI